MSDFNYTYDNDFWDALLPVNGSHDPFFPQVGFVFGSFSKEDNLRPAQLPQGWTIYHFNNEWNYLLDERNVTRAQYCIKTNLARMHPFHRFRIEKQERDALVKFIVWDRDVPHTEREKEIFSKEYSVPSRSKHPDIYKGKVQQYAEQKICEKWLEENYPKWHDYNAYWGESRENTIEEKDNERN